jgi:hypothetical protein
MPSQVVLLLLLGSVTAAFAGLLILRSALSNAPVQTRREEPPQEDSKSDGMDLLVALRPSNRRSPPPVPLHALPQPSDGGEERVREPAARATALPAPRQLEPEPGPRQRPRVETSKVVLWRGQLKYQLYVASLADDAGWRPLSVSPFFRLDDENIPTEQARKALKLLVKQLEREDWRVVSEGPRWYELTLERPRE